jgi:uncharacterized protein with LGFP repeats
LLVALAAAVTIPVLAASGSASADDDVAAGDTVVGEFVQVWPEYEGRGEAAEKGDEGPLSYVRTDDGDAVRLDTEDVEDVDVGATVEVTVGREVQDTASEDLGYDQAREVLETEVLATESSAPPPTAPATLPFTNSVTVAMVVPAGGTKDATLLADVVKQVNGPVADFWESETDGVIKIGVTASHDWISTTSTCEDPFDLWEEAAARVGFVEGPGKHLLLYVTSSPANMDACSYGLAEVGFARTSGGFAYVREAATSVIAHELGHNFSLGHSSAMQCDGQVNAGECGLFPYYDLYDVMGFSWDQLGSLNVVQTSRLVPVSQRAFDLTSPAETITLTPVSQRAGVRAAVLRTSHPFAHHWLEYRPATGRDSWLGTADNWAGLEAGVLLRLDASQTGGSDASLLLDGTPSPKAAWEDDFAAVLPVNTPVTIKDGHGGNGAYTVTVTAVGPAGATVQIVPATAVGLAHQASGGDGGPLGAPTAAEICGTLHVTQYCGRTYEHGEIYWRKNSGEPARSIHGGLYPAWGAAGGLATFGLPTSDTVCGLAAGGCRQTFVDGEVYWSPTTNLIPIRGAIRSWWLGQGGTSGALGYPTAAATCIARGCSQAFEGGSVVSWTSGGIRGLRGPIHDLWAAAGGLAGTLGFPTSDLQTVPGGTAQAFEGGSVYQSAATGAHLVRGAVRSAWWATGGVAGPLGFPTGEPVDVGGGTSSAFAGGAIYSSPWTGTHVLRGTVLNAFVGSGGVTGPLGYPVSGLLAVPGGSAAAFQGGSIYDSPATGAHVVRGAARSAWWATGGVSGPLGFPVTDFTALHGGGFAIDFQGGSIYESASTGAQVVQGDIRSAWWRSGGSSGPLGFPTSGLLSVPGGTAQAFSGGSVYWSPSTGAHALPYRVLPAWWTVGGTSGSFGFPVTDVLAIPGGSAVAFQGGSIYDSPATGPRTISGAIRSAWWATGGAGGPLGYPTSGLLSTSGGTAQAFSGGMVYSSAGGGTRAVPMSFRNPWWATGGEGGPMGFPVSDVLNVPGGTAQAFAAGSVYAAAGQPGHAVYGPTRNTWWGYGGVSGALGYPTESTKVSGSRTWTKFAGGILATTSTGVLVVGDSFMHAVDRVGGLAAVGLPVAAEGVVPGGRAQAFDRASVYWSPSTGAHVVSGPLRSAWWASGGVSGPYGYPTGDVVQIAPGEQSLDFATGTLYWSSTTGTRFVAL